MAIPFDILRMPVIRTILLILLFGLGSADRLICADIYVQQSGNWGDPTTWQGGVVPGSSDNAFVFNGFDVIVDTARTIGNVGIYGHASNSSLTVNAALTVSGAITFGDGGGSGTSTLTTNKKVSTGTISSSATVIGHINVIDGSDSLVLSSTATFSCGAFSGASSTTTISNAYFGFTTLNIASNSSPIGTSTNTFNVNATLVGQSITLSNVEVLNFDMRFSGCNIILSSGFTNSGGTMLADGTSGASVTINGNDLVTGASVNYPDLVFGGTSSIAGTLTVLGGLTINGSINSNGNAVNVGGNFTNNGTFTASSGDDVTLNGTSLQLITGTESTTFSDLITNNNAGVTVDLSGSDTCKISGSLEIQNGTLTTGDRVKLLDSGSGLAPLKEITGTGSISGEMTMQFRVGNASSPISNVDFRQLSMPVAGVTIADIQYKSGTREHGYYTYGFSGSNYTSTQYKSTFYYDNTSTSTASGGWTAATDTTNAVGYLQSASFYGGPGTGSGNKNFFFAEVSGVPHTATSGSIKINSTSGAKMAFRNDDELDWALVGNPYACQISNTNMTFTNCGDGSKVMWVYEADNGGFNTATSTVAPFQGFWVPIDAAGAEISIPESAKTGTQTNFLKSVKAKDKLQVKLI